MKNTFLILFLLLPAIVSANDQLIHAIKMNNGKVIDLIEIKEVTFIPSLQNLTTTSDEIFYSEEILSIILKSPEVELTLPATELLKEKILAPQLKRVGGDGSGGG